MSAPSPPRAVNAAFWCWVVAALLMILGGLMTASLSLPTVFRVGAILLAVAGAALAFLARRSRTGDERFRRAAIGLAFSIVVVLALFAVWSKGIFWLVPIILTVAGGLLIMSPSTQEWFDAKDTR